MTIRDQQILSVAGSFAVAAWLALAPAAAASEPCQSGPAVGQRPGPYSFLLATGDHRGKQHCYICDAADRPAVIVFAKTMSEPLGRLLVEIDQAVVRADTRDVRAWATFLSDDQPRLDPQLVKWSRQLGLRKVPLGVFEDKKGPPSYHLHDEAEVTILLAVQQKVVINFAYRSGELTEERIKEITAALPKILGDK
jgi:hypothetical protein